MSLVLDASATLSWYFEDERTEAGDALMRRVATTGAIVPLLWRYEVANGFIVAVRHRRITPAYRDASLAELRLFPITIDSHGDNAAWSTTLGLADQFGLTMYDAAYLELAHRLNLPFGTHDRALVSAAKALRIEIVG